MLVNLSHEAPRSFCVDFDGHPTIETPLMNTGEERDLCGVTNDFEFSMTNFGFVSAKNIGDKSGPLTLAFEGGARIETQSSIIPQRTLNVGRISVKKT